MPKAVCLSHKLRGDTMFQYSSVYYISIMGEDDNDRIVPGERHYLSPDVLDKASGVLPGESDITFCIKRKSISDKKK
ncbi:MAG: hypothetical protein GY750_19460 [Lentisphaerae bacterium]|nr:hypothetical protein [Lentisphaerota bacterium]MCP4103575.1 hypothetical protein [Lentisphaerota bacterium]